MPDFYIFNTFGTSIPNSGYSSYISNLIGVPIVNDVFKFQRFALIVLSENWFWIILNFLFTIILFSLYGSKWILSYSTSWSSNSNPNCTLNGNGILLFKHTINFTNSFYWNKDCFSTLFQFMKNPLEGEGLDCVNLFNLGLIGESIREILVKSNNEHDCIFLFVKWWKFSFSMVIWISFSDSKGKHYYNSSNSKLPSLEFLSLSIINLIIYAFRYIHY